MNVPRRAMTINDIHGDGSWFRIEWAKHDGRDWSEPMGKHGMRFCMSARLEPHTCVEGYAFEMRDIANAILAGGEASHKRCAVEMRPDNTAAFESPRNSGVPAIVHAEDARDLARHILATIPEQPSLRP